METTRLSLLLRVRNANDSAAWSEFDSIYRPILRRYATARGLGPQDVDDIVQDCFAALQQHIRSFDYDPARGHFKGWLRTMVNNRCTNLRRAKRPQPADDAALERPQTREPEPEAAFDEIWRQEHLQFALARVTPEFGRDEIEIFQRLALDGWSIERICKTWEIHRDQVYRIKWRVTDRLKIVLRDLLGADEDEGLSADEELPVG